MSVDGAIESRSRQALTVGQILADPEQMGIHSDTYFGMSGEIDASYCPSDPAIVSCSESEALLDLSRFTQQIGDAIELRTGRRVLSSGLAITPESILDDLRIIGRSELLIAADAISGLWADTIRTSKRGEALVGVERRGSSLLVYHMIMQALAHRHPDLVPAVVPFDLGKLSQTSSRRSRDRLRYGVELADDCLITGRQLRNFTHDLIKQGARPEGIRSQFVSVAEERQPTAVVRGTPNPRGVFTHPPFERGKPTITTTFSASDFGFKHVIGNALESAGIPVGTPSPTVSHPILLAPIKDYALPARLQGADLPEELRDRLSNIEKTSQQSWLDLSALA